MKKVHCQIEYKGEPYNIHSDICPPKCTHDLMDKEYKAFLHESLDEWLENSNGTGAFWIAEEDYKFENMK